MCYICILPLRRRAASLVSDVEAPVYTTTAMIKDANSLNSQTVTLSAESCVH